MVVAAVAGEVTRRLADDGALLRRQALAEARNVGDLEAQEVDVEVAGFLHVDDVEAEVAQAPDLEGAVQHDAADVVLGPDCSSHMGISLCL